MAETETAAPESKVEQTQHNGGENQLHQGVSHVGKELKLHQRSKYALYHSARLEPPYCQYGGRNWSQVVLSRQAQCYANI